MGKKSLTWIRLIIICYTVPRWPSWLSDQIAFSLKSFKSATIAPILHIGTERFSHSEFLSHPDASQQVSVQSDTVWEEMWVF